MLVINAWLGNAVCHEWWGVASHACQATRTPSFFNVARKKSAFLVCNVEKAGCGLACEASGVGEETKILTPQALHLHLAGLKLHKVTVYICMAMLYTVTTNLHVLALEKIRYLKRATVNISTKDKMAQSNVAYIQRFH